MDSSTTPTTSSSVPRLDSRGGARSADLENVSITINQTPTKPKKSKIRAFWRKLLSIRLLTIVIVIALVVLAIVIAYITQHFLIRSSVSQLSSSLVGLIALSVKTMIANQLDNALLLARLDNNTLSYNITNRPFSDRLVYIRHEYRSVQAVDFVDAISFGNIYGDSVGVRRVEPYTRNGDVTSDYICSTEDSSVDPTTLYEYSFNTTTLQPSDAPVLISNPYIIGQRPWFIAGSDTFNGSFAFTRPYISDHNALLVSLAQPFFAADGSFSGVLAFHLYIPRLKSYLLDLAILGPNTVILLDTSGNMVVDSCPFNTSNIETLLTCGEGGVPAGSMLPVNIQTTSGIYQQISDTVYATYGSFDNITNAVFVLQGRYWITLELLGTPNLNWLILIITDMELYTSNVRLANIYTIVFSCGFGFFSAVIAFIAGLAVTRPITRLIRNMDQISSMNFGKGDNSSTPRKSKGRSPSKSMILEISAMQKSLGKLQTALSSFEKFVPNSVVKEILSADIEATLGVQPRFVTMIFCNIQDFTTISETVSPDKLVGLLQEFLQTISVCIEETSGTIDKFMGDTVMAFWNAPHPIADHEIKACQTALECYHEISSALQPKWVSATPHLDIRVGIHTGEVLIGNVGSRTRINYTAIGDNVNTTARIQSLGKFYHVRILVSSVTYYKVRHQFLCRPLDLVVVKGKSQPLVLYELVAEETVATPEQRELCDLSTKAFELTFSNDNQQDAISAYEHLHEVYPTDTAISRVYSRIRRLAGHPDWPGMEIFDHK